MISLLGRGAVLLALAACATGAITGLSAGWRSSEPLMRVTRGLAYVFGLSMVVAVGLMEWALLSHDFSVAYVAQVGSRSSPTWVSVVSLWSSLEGSILLWAFILGVFTASFAWWTRDKSHPQSPFALGVTLAVGVFFCFLVSGEANPFGLMDPVPTDGPGPNPLLQNHILMVIHPPSLYLGFVGISVPFGMASGALLAGRLDAAWTRALRRWTLLPWGFLTVGIILGGWWSYEVLGWGGYWAWDPVENASFLPWLTATAYIHSAMVMERKEHLKGWTLALVMSTFLLTILGTFMTRSGVFNSVHAFTQSPIGPVFLTFLALCLVFSVVLLAARMEQLQPPPEDMEGPFSREYAFLLNNLLLCAFTFTVLLGTLYPLVNEVVTGKQISVGEPYFNSMAVPIAVVLVFLMGVGPALPWGRASGEGTVRRLILPTGAAALVLTVGLIAGLRQPWALLNFAVCAFALVVQVLEFLEPARSRADRLGESLPVAVYQVAVRARRRFGGYIVHLGVIIIAVSVGASSVYRQQDHVTLVKDRPREIGAYTLTFVGTEVQVEPHRRSEIARFAVQRGGRDLGLLEPRMNNYLRMGQPIGTPAVKTTLREDLYLSVIQINDEAETVSLDVIVQPLVVWLWLGGGVMIFGTLFAAWPGRRRSVVPAAAVAPALPGMKAEGGL